MKHLLSQLLTSMILRSCGFQFFYQRDEESLKWWSSFEIAMIMQTISLLVHVYKFSFFCLLIKSLIRKSELWSSFLNQDL